MNLDDFFGPPVDPRYLQAVARQKAERNPPHPPIACTPDDLEATGDDGHLGLFVVLRDQGWILSEQQRETQLIITARNSDGSYVVATGGETEADAALRLFKKLYSDEPDAIACAAAFWPPPAPVAESGVRS